MMSYYLKSLVGSVLSESLTEVCCEGRNIKKRTKSSKAHILFDKFSQLQLLLMTIIHLWHRSAAGEPQIETLKTMRCLFKKPLAALWSEQQHLIQVRGVKWQLMDNPCKSSLCRLFPTSNQGFQKIPWRKTFNKTLPNADQTKAAVFGGTRSPKDQWCGWGITWLHGSALGDEKSWYFTNANLKFLKSWAMLGWLP